MDTRDLFLEQHAAVPSAKVGGDHMSAAERTFAGLTDEQCACARRRLSDSMRLAHVAHRPRAGRTSWSARSSPGALSSQTRGWKKRLGVTRPNLGIGMTSPEVSELTRQMERGERSASIATRWAPHPPDGLGLQAGGLGRHGAGRRGRTHRRVGRLRAADRGAPRGSPPAGRAAGLLSAIALLHSAAHMGEAATVRTAGGFGTGI